METNFSEIPDDDIYDAVYTDDDHDIYEDLCALRRQSEEQVLDVHHFCMGMACWILPPSAGSPPSYLTPYFSFS